MAQLTRAQFDTLYKALLLAFPTRREIQLLVGFALEENLDSLVVVGNLADQVLHLMQWAERHNHLDTLVWAALAKNPTNPDLKDVAADILKPPKRPQYETLWDSWTKGERSFQGQLVAAQTIQAKLQVMNTELQQQLIAATAEQSQLRKSIEHLTTLNQQLQQQVDPTGIRLEEYDHRNKTLQAELQAAYARLARLEASPSAPATPLSAPSSGYPDRLTPAQHKAGHAALLTAFTKRSDLALLTRQTLDVMLNSISSDADLSSVLTDLLDWAEAKGRLPALLAGIAEANPENRRLQAWLVSLRGAQ